MPFDPPATVVSKGTTGYLSEFSLGDNSSPPNWTPIAELKSFKLSPISVPNVDFTTLKSPQNTRELRPGMIMPGAVECSGNYIGSPDQLAISTNAQAQDVVPVKATFPVDSAGGVIKTGVFISTAYVKDLNLGPFENDKPTEYQANFQTAGAYTLVTMD